MWRGMGSWRAEMQVRDAGFPVGAEMERGRGRVLQEGLGLVGVASCRPLRTLGLRSDSVGYAPATCPSLPKCCERQLWSRPKHRYALW